MYGVSSANPMDGRGSSDAAASGARGRPEIFVSLALANGKELASWRTATLGRIP